MEQILLYIFCGTLGIALLVGVILFFLREKRSPPSPPPGSPSPPPPPPTPAPAARARSYGWIWWIVVILAAIIVYHFIAPALRTTAPAPQATPPKKELRQYTKSFPLEFLGAENIVGRGPGWIRIQKDRGRANFRVRDIPIMPGAKYKIYLYSERGTTGLDWLEINAGKGNRAPFCYENHPASDYPIKTIFFEEGMGGEERYFYPRDNFLRLWADDELTVHLDKMPYVEITYWQ